MRTLSIALATRLRRKIFSAGNIPTVVIQLVKEALSEMDCLLTDFAFVSEYGLLLEISAPDNLEPEKISFSLRTYTSKRIRNKFPELWSMPSLWTRRFYSEENAFSDAFKENAERFFFTVKTR